jgi:rhodanese-like domain containing protein
MDKLKNRLKRCMDPSDINIEQMETLIKQGAIVIDVRSPQEFAEGHIPGAICIPEYNIQREIRNKVPNINSLIIVYCDSGVRSKNAQKRLQKMGYKQVYNLCK